MSYFTHQSAVNRCKKCPFPVFIPIYYKTVVRGAYLFELVVFNTIIECFVAVFEVSLFTVKGGAGIDFLLQMGRISVCSSHSVVNAVY